jgi:hypothetical protein
MNIDEVFEFQRRKCCGCKIVTFCLCLDFAYHDYKDNLCDLACYICKNCFLERINKLENGANSLIRVNEGKVIYQ